MNDQLLIAKMGLSTKSALCLVCGSWYNAQLKTCPECDKRTEEEMETLLNTDKETWEKKLDILG